MDLFAYAESYPVTAGFKVDGTSREAAQSINAAGLQAKVLTAFRRHGPMTADQCAVALNIDRLAVRPRCTELKELGKLRDSGQRRPNASGRSAVVWCVTSSG